MKNLGKQLSLNTTTIDILDDKALESVKGGAGDAAASCGISLICKTCNKTEA